MKSTGIAWKMESSKDSEPSATVVTDVSRWGNNGSMTASKPDLVRIPPKGLWVYDFNGTDAVIDVGDIKRLIKAVSFWAEFDDITTRSLLDLDGGTHSVEIDGSSDITATGWSSPAIYVEAVAAPAIAATGIWYHIVVTTATPFLVSDFDIGKETNYFDGKITLLVLYEYAPSAGKVVQIRESQRQWGGV